MNNHIFREISIKQVLLKVNYSALQLLNETLYFTQRICIFNRKYEEIYPPDVGEFVYITDDTYSKAQVIKMENLILKVLSFDLTVPTHLTFLMEYCVSNNLPDKVRFLAMVSSSEHNLDT